MITPYESKKPNAHVNLKINLTILKKNVSIT